MKVSIITPVYNAEEFLKETYDSILAQTFTDWEWLVVDDGSKDNSLAILEEFAAADKRIQVFRNTYEKGPGGARNVGIENASGKYMTFLDSDDYWYPTFLEKSLSAMKNKSVGFVYASYERWDDDLKHKYDDFIVPEKLTYKQLLRTCPISCLTAFIDIERLGKKHMSNRAKRQDYGLWLDYVKEIDYAYGIEEPLAKYRIRKNSVSAKKTTLIKHQFMIYYEQQNLNFFKSIFYTLSWAYHGFKKYKNIKR